MAIDKTKKYLQNMENGRVFVWNEMLVGRKDMREISGELAEKIQTGEVPALPESKKDVLADIVLPDFDAKAEPNALSNQNESIKGFLVSMEKEELLAYSKKNFGLNQNGEQDKEVLIQEILAVMENTEQL